MTRVLLYSGGMDSWLISKLWKPDIKLYIDIKGSYSEIEKKFLEPDVKIIEFPLGIFEKESKFIPMRNLYFLMLATNYGDEICLGATAGDRGVQDKVPEFFDRAEDIMNFLLKKQSNQKEDKKIKIEKKYLNYGKQDLVKEYIKSGGTLEEIKNNSFSCYNSNSGEPCYNCKPCFRKFVTLYNFGYKYKDEEIKKIFEHIRNEVVPKSKNKNNTYYSKRNSEGEIAEKVVKELYDKFGLDITKDEKC